VGREREVEALRAFLNNPKQLSWWLVAGHSGQGKSRLAMEFCLGLGDRWAAGFLPKKPNADLFERWLPDRPTLIVIDYLVARAGAAGEIIRQLYAHRASFKFPIRVLLLERDSKGAWESQFWGRGSEEEPIRATSYAAPLQLKPLNDDALWEVVKSIWPPGSSFPERPSTLRQIRKIDPNRRTLIAAVFSDALSRSDALTEVPKWDYQTIIRTLLEREEHNRWAEMGVTQTEKEVLVFATLLGGIDISGSARPVPKYLQERLDSEAFSYDRFQQMVAARADGFLPAFEPDLLGELYVLEFARQNVIKGRAANVRKLHEAAWRYNEFDVRHNFVYRALGDFPSHAGWVSLLEPILTPVYGPRAWLQAATHCAHAFAAAGNLDALQALFESVKRVIANEKKSHNGILAHVELWNVAEGLMSVHLTAGRIHIAHQILDEVYAYKNDFAKSHFVTVIAMANLAEAYLAAPDKGGAARLYKTIRKHSKHIRIHPNLHEFLNQKLDRLGFKRI